MNVTDRNNRGGSKMNKKTLSTIILLVTTISFTLLCTLTASASPLSYLKSDIETKEMYSLIEQGKDYLGLMRLYARECMPIRGSAEDSEDSVIIYTAGLLNFEKGKNPAFISAYYNYIMPEDGVEFKIQTATTVNPYSEEWDNSYIEVINDTSVYNNKWYEIYTKGGIDYIKISNGGQNMFMVNQEESYYKFNGKELLPVCSASEYTTFEYDSLSDTEIKGETKDTNYEVNDKATTKEKYDAFIKGFKHKQTLFYCMAGCPGIGDPEGNNDYQYLLDEFKKVPSIITMWVDGMRYDFKEKPVNINGRVLVPLRAIGETMGAEVIWDAVTKKVTLTKDESVVELTVDSNKAFVDYEEYELDVPATLINSKVYVPVRFIVESLGGEIYYNAKSKEILISDYIIGE